MSSILHVVPGLNEPWCGIAVAARLLAKAQGAELVDAHETDARMFARFDEIWVHSMWAPMVVKASVKALLHGIKLVRMPHGCTDPTKLKHHWHKKRWVAPIERWLFRHADRIIATCEDEVSWINAFEPRVKIVELIHLASPIPHSSAIASSAAKPSCSILHPSLLKLLYVGRLHKLKGVTYLLDAIAQLPSPQSVELRLIGKDEGEGKSLKEQASRLNLNAKFEGIVSEDEKNAAYDWCDVLVLPTLSENFGLVIAEALERGKRVITTDGAPAWGDGNTYGDRLTYLRDYRDGTSEERVQLLKDAIEKVSVQF